MSYAHPADRFETEIPPLAERLAWSAADSSDFVSRDLSTGLPNRRSLQRFLTSTLPGGRRAGTALRAFLVRFQDLEERRAENGQPTLRTAARRQRWMQAAGRELADVAGDSGMVGRWSGDEVLALVPTPNEDSSAALERRLADLEKRIPSTLGFQVLSADVDVHRLHATEFQLADTLLASLPAAG